MTLNLEAEARRFRSDLRGLLNRTICEGIPISAVTEPGPEPVVVVGYNLTRRQWVPEESIPLSIGRRRPRAYLDVLFRLAPDEENEYLMVQSSVFALRLSPDRHRDPLFHYDYERDKPDGYPEAHLQVYASSPEWDEFHAGGRSLARVHFPVGGRRFRPTVEDLVEFLVIEGLVDSHPDALAACAEGREDFRRRQLRAAIRRDPETAREAVARLPS